MAEVLLLFLQIFLQMVETPIAIQLQCLRSWVVFTTSLSSGDFGRQWRCFFASILSHYEGPKEDYVVMKHKSATIISISAVLQTTAQALNEDTGKRNCDAGCFSVCQISEATLCTLPTQQHCFPENCLGHLINRRTAFKKVCIWKETLSRASSWIAEILQEHIKPRKLKNTQISILTCTEKLFFSLR